MSNVRFAVIGSNSFSGAHFVNYLLDKSYEVLGISRSVEPHSIFLPYKLNAKNIDPKPSPIVKKLNCKSIKRATKQRINT